MKRIHHKPILIRVGDNLFWCRMEGDNITDVAVISDSYEPWFQEIFKPKAGDVVLDIGAHIGKYSVIGGKSVGPSGKVIAIEADPDNFKVLRLNIETNHLQDRVYAINAAVWNEVTTISLFRDVFSGRHSVCKRAENSVQVKTVTVDAIVRQDSLTKIDWMKVDIEGAEYAVLLGAKETIATKKLILLLLEVHNRETLD
ncbi:MAG: FkbM family methyltransferase, partial [Nitrososphaerales archaeon]